jgi:hypothetical protein
MNGRTLAKRLIALHKKAAQGAFGAHFVMIVVAAAGCAQ